MSSSPDASDSFALEEFVDFTSYQSPILQSNAHSQPSTSAASSSVEEAFQFPSSVSYNRPAFYSPGLITAPASVGLPSYNARELFYFAGANLPREQSAHPQDQRGVQRSIPVIPRLPDSLIGSGNDPIADAEYAEYSQGAPSSSTGSQGMPHGTHQTHPGRYTSRALNSGPRKGLSSLGRTPSPAVRRSTVNARQHAGKIDKHGRLLACNGRPPFVPMAEEQFRALPKGPRRIAEINRRSAYASRQRKKARLEQLSCDAQEAEEEYIRLKAEVSSLEQQCLLRYAVAYGEAHARTQLADRLHKLDFDFEH